MFSKPLLSLIHGPQGGVGEIAETSGFFLSDWQRKAQSSDTDVLFLGLLVEWTSFPRDQYHSTKICLYLLRSACIFEHFLLSKIRGNGGGLGPDDPAFFFWNCWSLLNYIKWVEFQPAPFGSTWTLREALRSSGFRLRPTALWVKLRKDFFYLPMNRRHRQGIGYAFINFQAEGTAKLFKEAGGSDRRLDGWNFLIRKRYTKFTPSCCRCVIQSFCSRLLWTDFHKGCRKGTKTQLFWIIKKLNSLQTSVLACWISFLTKERGTIFPVFPSTVGGFWMGRYLPCISFQAMCGYQFPGRNSKKVVHVAVAQLQGRQEVGTVLKCLKRLFSARIEKPRFCVGGFWWVI